MEVNPPDDQDGGISCQKLLNMLMKTQEKMDKMNENMNFNKEMVKKKESHGYFRT